MAAKHALQGLGHANFASEGQKQMLELVLQNECSVLAVLGTGSGKSMSWVCPSVIESGLNVVVIPLLALMQDVTSKLEAVPRNVLPRERWCTWSRFVECNLSVESVERMDLRLLLVSAEQAADPVFLDLLGKQGERVKRVIFDEPTLYLSSSFRRNLRSVPLLVRAKTEAPFVLLSATIEPKEEATLSKAFHSELQVVRACTTRRNVGMTVVTLSSSTNLVDALAAHVKTEGAERTIIFAMRTAECDSIASALKSKNIGACASHSKLSPHAQATAKRAWVQGSCPVLVATSGLLYGVDYPSVRQVIFVGGAYSMADLVQGLGRAGRDGELSECTMLLAAGKRVEGDAQVADYLQRPNRCRAVGLSAIFDPPGLATITECGLCDVCRRAGVPRATRWPTHGVVQRGFVGQGSGRAEMQSNAKRAIHEVHAKLDVVLNAFSKAGTCSLCLVTGSKQHSKSLAQCPLQFRKCFKCFGAHSSTSCPLFEGFRTAMTAAGLCITCSMPTLVAGKRTHRGDNFASTCEHRGRLLPAAMLALKAQLTKCDLSGADLLSLTGVSAKDGLLPTVAELLHSAIVRA